ncbi:MAG: ComF family protein [Flavobacteriales bacterium]|nr:ComF family protein [Flavobacteriales bacterium]
MSNFFLSIILWCKSAFSCILEVISPHTCVVCGEPLDNTKESVCHHCMGKVMYTDYAVIRCNPMEMRVEELTGVKVTAMALMVYMHGGVSGKVISAFKYQGRRDLALWAGQEIGKELIKSDRFSSFDTYVPIPLHEKRQKKRGYNQSQLLCEGIAKYTAGNVLCALERNVNTHAQAHLSREKRWQNAQGIFSISPSVDVKGKNVAVVDDVFTTGATVSEAVKVLHRGGAHSVAVITLSAGE